ncbi:MAG: GNAT family N-acetyltransferase [Anaerolineales bacterium]
MTKTSFPFSSDWQVRQADTRDRSVLADWLTQELHIHRHLDWRPPLDWLGHPFWWVLEAQARPVAALACPDDPPEIAWLRLFAHTSNVSATHAWRALWSQARQVLMPYKPMIAAIAIEYWMEPLLQEAHFDLRQWVVVLERRSHALSDTKDAERFPIRPMRAEDLKAVAQVDWDAFPPPWRHSLDSLRRAFAQALYASVLELDGKILGYQITTGHPFGAHLARLAVHSQVQGHGWGRRLLEDLFAFLRSRRIERLTVNTQHDNRVSLSLYRRVGFERTGEEYPVYVYDWR